MRIANQYFDFYNIDVPVQHFADDVSDVFLNDFSTNFIFLKVQKNKYTLNDNLIGLNPSSEGTFYSMSSADFHYLTTQTQVPFMVWVMLDSKVEIHERSVTTMLDIFGTIGGIFELLDIILGATIAYITTISFMSSVSKNLLNLTQTENAEAENSNSSNHSYYEEEKQNPSIDNIPRRNQDKNMKHNSFTILPQTQKVRAIDNNSENENDTTTKDFRSKSLADSALKKLYYIFCCLK